MLRETKLLFHCRGKLVHDRITLKVRIGSMIKHMN